MPCNEMSSIASHETIMRINLFSANAAALTLHGEIQLEGDMLSAWREVGLDYDDGSQRENRHLDILSTIAGYRSGGNAHQILFRLSRHRHDGSDDSPWYLHLNYICPAAEGRHLQNPPREAIGNTRKLETLLDESALSGAVSDFHFDLNCTFEQGSIETIIAIPLIQFNDSSLPFTNIRGLRLTKEKEAGTGSEYEVVLNARRNGMINSNVSFHSTEALNTRLLNKLLTQANDIMAKFIKKKDNN